MVQGHIADLLRLRVFVDPEIRQHAWYRTLYLAAHYGLTSYDASYLELALRLRVPLATLDKALIRAAEAENVPLFWK